ncbi:MAG: DUF3320 domain-containing protein, partial [Planctomycetes bacterium]|nr:DUF3320 domain-containing protein [Planctomycetota bacterium]
TARDRDRIRAAVLEGLGWKLCRVWSTDFWQNPVGEIDRLEAAIAAAKAEWEARDDARQREQEGERLRNVAGGADAGAALPESAADLDAGADAGEGVADSGAEPIAAPAPDPHGPRPYTAAVLSSVGDVGGFHAVGNAPLLRACVERVLALEAPIVFDRLVKIVARAWGVSRVTERVRGRIREVMPPAVFEHEGALFAREVEVASFTGFRAPLADGTGERDADELPRIEVDHAMRWLLQQHHALSAEDLAREAARSFGITRLGAVVRGVMDDGVARLVASGDAERDGDVVRLPAR